MALGLTQPLTEMSTRSFSWGKDGRCARLSTLPPPCAVVVKSGNLNSLEPSGPPQACNGTALPLPKYYELDTVVDGRIVFEVTGFTDVTLCHSASNSRRFERT